VKEVEIEKWNQVLHAPFDGASEDNFTSTSIHLSFTEYQMPFDVGNRGGIDNDLYFVETLISVLDRGKWVADLDVLALHRAQQTLLRRGAFDEKCLKHASSRFPKHLISFDTWEEVLDTPEKLGQSFVGVVRAHESWMGRLAAACVSVQKGYRTVLLPPGYDQIACWSCCLQHPWYWSEEALQSRGGESDTGRRESSTSLDAQGDDSDDSDSDGSTGTVFEYNEYDDEEDDPISGLPHVFIF